MIALIVAGALATGCSWPDRQARLLPIALPDLSRVDPAVRAQARERYEALIRTIADRSTPQTESASAYGQYGMLLQAAGYLDAAEPCYLNAQTLARDEIRWPYYLAHLYRSKGETDRSEAAFRQVLALRPDDFPALVWLGRLLLDKGRPEEAEPLFAKALALMPRSVAALAGLGQANLARRDFAGAARHFEEALAIDPASESLHSPLAMAYRGLGQLDKAAPHLRQWKNTDIAVPDPLQQELDLLLESGLSYELRGVRALDARDFNLAAAFFRKGVELTPDSTSLRRSLQHKLGTALFMTGQLGAAAEQFEAVVREAPAEAIDESAAKAYTVSASSRRRRGGGRRPASTSPAQCAINRTTSRLDWRWPTHSGGAATLRRRSVSSEEALRINPRSGPGAAGLCDESRRSSPLRQGTRLAR